MDKKYPATKTTSTINEIIEKVQPENLAKMEEHDDEEQKEKLVMITVAEKLSDNNDTRPEHYIQLVTSHKEQVEIIEKHKTKRTIGRCIAVTLGVAFLAIFVGPGMTPKKDDDNNDASNAPNDYPQLE